MMRNLINIIAIFLLTLLIALVTFNAWNAPVMPDEMEIPVDLDLDFSPVETTVCGILIYSNKSNGKVVSFQATLFGRENNLVLYPLDCGIYPDEPQSFFPFIEINGLNKINENRFSILYKNSSPSDKPHYKNAKEVDVQVTGLVTEYYNEFGKKQFSIIPQKIKTISPFRQFFPKGAA